MKINPKWKIPTVRYIKGERFYSTGTRYKKKSEAEAYAKLMREKGHKARVIKRKGLTSGYEYVVIRDKYQVKKMKVLDNYSDEDYLRMRKFLIKRHAIKKQQILKKMGIKSKIVKTTKLNKLFPRGEQKMSAYKVVRIKR